MKIQRFKNAENGLVKKNKRTVSNIDIPMSYNGPHSLNKINAVMEHMYERMIKTDKTTTRTKWPFDMK